VVKGGTISEEEQILRGKFNERKPNIDRLRRAEGDGVENSSETQTEIRCLAGGGSCISQLRFVRFALP